MGNNASVAKEEKFKRNQAILEYSNGERYNGAITEGMRNGFGTYYYKNGEKFEGNWFKNQKHGRGIFFNKTGEVYEGMWHNNKKEGVGTYYYNNGERYYGEWKNDKKQGRGIESYVDGAKFIGQFKNNKKYGMGENIKKDGGIVYEDWLDGKLLKQSEKLKYAPGVKYDFDYTELNTGNFEKYLETKTKHQNEGKLNQIKSKYFTLEYAKKLKSKNIDNYYDSVRMIHSTNHIVLEKPDINLWNVEDVVELFKKIGYEKFTEKIRENNITGSTLVTITTTEISKIFEIKDEKELAHLTKSLETVKNLSKQTENLKSLQRNLSSIAKEKANEIVEEENIHKSESETEEKQNKVFLFNDNVVLAKDQTNHNLTNNHKDLEMDFMLYLTSPGMNFDSSVNLNGLNYFINYDELTLKEEVGQGGFGRVYKSYWNGKKVAVKKIALKNTKYMDNIKKFINEINIISSLRHPNIVLYMGASIESDNYYMITEYLPKGSLFDYMHKNKGQISERDQVNIAYEIAVALKYLHSRNVVHRDLKSSNILIDDNWKIKIGDFGLSKFFDKKNPEQNRGRNGTPHWMAPEILKGDKYEFSADIFSFGMILWEILTLEIPYYGINPIQVISIVADEKKIVKVPEQGNPVLRSLVEKCLQYEPQNRPKLDDIVDIINKLKYRNNCFGKNLIIL